MQESVPEGAGVCPSCPGGRPWRRGAKRGSQAYLGPRALPTPGDMMIDWVSPPARMRPLSLFRPSACPCAAGSSPAAAAGAGRGCAPSDDGGCGLPGPAARHGNGHRWNGGAAGSGGGERVVAELSQDVAGLADQLAGLRQGGDLAVLAVLDRRVVAVAGCRSAGVGLAGLIGHPAQDLRALPGQCPGERLPSEE